MTDTQQASIESKDDTPQTPSLQSPGAMMRAQRESAGVSQQAVSEALHLTVHYIKALENDEYGKLPGLTFVKGYFRAYSRFLGMNVDEVLACYERYLADQGLQVETNDFVPSSSRRGRSDQSLVWALVAGTILVIALAAGWWFFGRELDARSAAAPAVTAPPSQQTTPATASVNVAVNATPPSAFTATPAATTDVPQQQGVEPPAALEPADAGVAIINATLEARQEAEALALEESVDPAQAADTSVTDQQVAGAIDGATTNADTAPDAAATEASTQSAQEMLALPATAELEIEQTVADATEALSATEVRNDLEYVTAEDGRRVITHHGAGNDRLELNLNGSSWAEVKNAQGANIFNNMLRQGDQLVIQGEAPFAVLLGDARQVQASFNAQRVDLSTLIRNDNTARFELGPSGVSTPAFTTSQASATE